MPHSKSRLNLKLLPLLLIPLLVLILGLKSLTRPISQEENYQSIIIKKSASASQISQLLKEKQIIKSPLLFKLYLRATGQQNQIQAGSHRLSPHLNFSQIADIITGPPEGIWVTFPEGWRREQYAEELAESFDLTSHSEPDEIGSKNPPRYQDQDSGFSSQDFLDHTTNLEGRLFPDTYLFPSNATTRLVINTLTDTFNQKTTDILDRLQNQLTPDQTLVLASILERETLTEEEKPIVAGILLNRLQAGWPLQADATVQYAIASQLSNTSLSAVEGREQPNSEVSETGPSWWPQNLTPADLDLDSPYNTYKYPGLPPAPICNPGLESLKAAANPAQSDYWYYLHDQKGQIHYAQTLEEHHSNVAKYLN
jgi:UPF0755 protein